MSINFIRTTWSSRSGEIFSSRTAIIENPDILIRTDWFSILLSINVIKSSKIVGRNVLSYDESVCVFEK